MLGLLPASFSDVFVMGCRMSVARPSVLGAVSAGLLVRGSLGESEVYRTLSEITTKLYVN